MHHGGKRNGAGRPKGTPGRKIAAATVEAVATGLTPAEVMQKAMEIHYEAKRYDQAAAIAKDLAPYVHPRLAAIQHSGSDGGPLRLVEELVVIEFNGHADTPEAIAPGAGAISA